MSDKDHPKKVFISYGHEDAGELAYRLENDLRSEGYDVWIDKSKMKSGKPWEEQIEKGILETEVIVALLSPHAVRRPDGVCLDEISMARYNNRKIVPVMVLMCRPPLAIYRLDWVDFQNYTSDAIYRKSFERLLDAVRDTRDQSVEGRYASVFSSLHPLDFGIEISRHMKNFVGREWFFERIAAWINSKESQVLYITGDPGCGKSALMAYFVDKDPNVFAYHFCKYNLKDTKDARCFVRSIASQLATQLKDYCAALEAKSLLELADAFPDVMLRRLVIEPLRSVTSDKPIIIVIDALDEAFADPESDLVQVLSARLVEFPPNIKLIITSRKVPEIVDFLSRFNPYEIVATSQENLGDVKRLLERRLNEAGIKELFERAAANTEEAIEAIADKAQGNFLYATRVIEDIRNGRIDPASAAEFPRSLVEAYMNYFERAFETREHFKKIRPLLETIIAACEPLNAAQIAHFTNRDPFDVESDLELIAEMIPRENGRYQAYHRSLADWLCGEGGASNKYRINKQSGHKSIAGACWSEYAAEGLRERDSYCFKHIVTHLMESKRWDNLFELLKDPTFFGAMWKANRYLFMEAWETLESNSSHTKTAAYAHVLGEPERYAELVSNVAALFYITGHPDEAITLLRFMIDTLRLKKRHGELQKALGEYAWILYQRRDYESAASLCEERERICEEMGDDDGLQQAIGHKALIEQDRGRLDEAILLLKRKEEICRKMDNLYSLQAALGNQANIHLKRGEMERALELNRQKEEICKDMRYMENLGICYGNRAVIMIKMRRLEEALFYCEREEEIYRRSGNKVRLQQNLGNQASIYYELKARSVVLSLVEERIELCERIGNIRDLADAYRQKIAILRELHRSREAAACLEMMRARCYSAGEEELGMEIADYRAMLQGELDRNPLDKDV
jgi:tetratricopeptide (TPR) repeat protein